MKRRSDVLLAGAALLALVWLGWALARPAATASARHSEAVLWTDGAVVTGKDATDGAPHFSLGAVSAPAQARPIPDLAYLRRALPALRRLDVRGDGLEPAELSAAHGLELFWRRTEARPERPVLRLLSVPRTLARGERLEVRGRWTG